MIKEFRDFLLRGNVIDLAVALIIGGAFGKIVTSLVNDILMPFVGKAMGGTDFSQLFYSLDGKEYASLTAAEEVGAAVVKYGVFINTIIDFVIVGACIFSVVKAYEHAMKKKEAVEEAAGPSDIDLLTEIRDALKKS